MKLHLKTITFLSVFTSLNGFVQTVFALQPEAIYQKANSAVVLVVAPQNPKQVSYGSGVIIDPKGLIVTANHVVANRQNVLVKVSDNVYRGAVLARDRTGDLALIKLQSQHKFPSLRLQSIPPRIGQKIYTLGNPLALEKSFTDGIVSRLENNGAIQYTAPTNHGNSGGPLLDEDGDVIGIVKRGQPEATGRLAPGIYFAIPTSRIRTFILTLRRVPLPARQAATNNANGLVQLNLGNYRQAIENFDRAIQRQPRSASIYINRANAHLHLKDYQSALEDYTQAIQKNPSYSAAYYSRAAVYLFLKNKQKALQDYNSAIRVNRNWGNRSVADAYYYRGVVRVALKDRKSAIADFETAADLYLKQGRTREYQKSLNQAIRLSVR